MQESQRMATLLESISDAFVALDKHWRYTYVNAKAGQILQRQPEDLLGKHIWTEFPEGVGQPLYHACRRALADQLPLNSRNTIHPATVGLNITSIPSRTACRFFSTISLNENAPKRLSSARIGRWK